MKKMILIAIMALTVVVVSTCHADKGPVDPVTGQPYPTLEPVVWESLEE